MKQEEMAKAVTVEYILAKLYEINENPEIPIKDKLAAIRMCGDYLKMFDRQKKVQIDIRGLIAQMTDGELRSLTHGKERLRLDEGSSVECPDYRVVK